MDVDGEGFSPLGAIAVAIPSDGKPTFNSTSSEAGWPMAVALMRAR
jgi:hypothetical protein